MGNPQVVFPPKKLFGRPKSTTNRGYHWLMFCLKKQQNVFFFFKIQKHVFFESAKSIFFFILNIPNFPKKKPQKLGFFLDWVALFKCDTQIQTQTYNT